MKNTYILTLSCPDKSGIVHAVSGLLLEHGANIEEAAQFNDAQTGLFFMRVQFASEKANQDEIELAFQQFNGDWNMTFDLRPASRKMPTVIMVSQQGHCLNDLLFRWKSGLLPVDIKAIISNHRDFYQLAANYNIPFHHIKVTADTKAEAEAKQLDVIRAEGAELVVLARYMQVLSPDFVSAFPDRIINIHHSFLPAFDGARPYHRAYARGVKLIGATSHYVTNELDEGPIIEQEVVRISHRDEVDDLIAKGRDLEKVVLSRAVRWHADNRVLSYCNRTVVFD